MQERKCKLMDKEEIFEKIKNFFKNEEAIYIFGSYAKDNFNEDSDIDIAIVFKNKKTPLEIFKLQEELSLILKKDVDLVDLESVNTVFAYEIVNNSIKLKTSKNSESLENRIWWNYLTLQDDRKEIIEDFVNDSKKDNFL
jgi:predicted nucleotidyltransferase